MSSEQQLTKRAMPYGSLTLHRCLGDCSSPIAVRIGKSGLKVSKIILGTMQYGSSQWQSWVLDDEEEMVRHVKTA